MFDLHVEKYNILKITLQQQNINRLQYDEGAINEKTAQNWSQSFSSDNKTL